MNAPTGVSLLTIAFSYQELLVLIGCFYARKSILTMSFVY